MTEAERLALTKAALAGEAAERAGLPPREAFKAALLAYDAAKRPEPPVGQA